MMLAIVITHFGYLKVKTRNMERSQQKCSHVDAEKTQK